MKEVETGTINKLIFCMGNSYFLKQKLVVVQTLEWKFKASIARNATIEAHLGPNFCPILV